MSSTNNNNKSGAGALNSSGSKPTALAKAASSINISNNIPLPLSVNASSYLYKKYGMNINDLRPNKDKKDDNKDAKIDKDGTDNNKPEKTESVLTQTKTYVTFLLFFGYAVFFIILSFFFGAVVLYCCKVGTSNILPTYFNCSPYDGSVYPDVTPIDIDIDISKINGKYFSTKINFPYNKSDDPIVNKIADYNKSNFILDWLREEKEVYNSWGVKVYFISVIEKLFLKNYAILNSILQFMNRNMYELVILIFGQWLLGLVSSGIAIYTFVYSIYLWFAEYKWLFKENLNTDEDSKPDWNPVTFISLVNFCISCAMTFWIFVALILLYIFLMPSVMAASHFFFTLCMISTLLMKSMISDGINIKEPYGIKKTFMDLLSSKMSYVMFIISVVLILMIYLTFGSFGAICSLVIFGILFAGLVGNNLYKREVPADATAGLANPDGDQAIKMCGEKLTNKSLYRTIFSQSGGDVDLLNKLKSLSKSLKN